MKIKLQVKTPTFLKMQVHENGGEFEILEKQVFKVEYLFSICTQKAKYRISTQETLEKDQGIDRREKRILLL